MKRLPLYIITMLLVLSSLLSACSSGPAKVRVATDATYPPFETVDEKTKELTGYDIDMMKAVAAKANIQIEFVNVAFDPLLAGMAQCQYDAAVSAITITDERKQSMLFSTPYINAGQIISVKKDNKDITNKESLKGKKVGAQISTTGAIETQKISGATLKTYDTIDLAFLDLSNGQVDAVVTDYPTAMSFIAKSPEKIKSVGDVFTDESYGVAVCKKNTDLQKKINDALAALKSDGTLQKLDEKWVKGK